MPSVSSVLAVLALVVAVAGTAAAAPDALRKLDKKEQKQVKKIAKKEANKVLNKRAGSLNVARANTATTANTADVANAIAPGTVQADSFGTLTLRTTSETIPTNTAEAASVSCNAGEQMISGGTSTNGVGLVDNWTLIRSGPSGNGWSAAARNDTGSSGDLIAQVVCLAP
jgi:hypothetical protein